MDHDVREAAYRHRRAEVADGLGPDGIDKALRMGATFRIVAL